MPGSGRTAPRRGGPAVVRRWLAAATVAGLAGAVLAVAGPSAGPAGAGAQPVVSSGGGHSCALMPDQSVWCWGLNTTGQLGNGGKADSTVPGKVAALPPATGIAAGFGHTCAVDTAANVWCWGSNAFGELGNGTTSSGSTVPVETQNLQALQVSAGRDLSCAVTTAHNVKCWGDGNFGELGNGTTADSSIPRLVKNLTGVSQVAAGYFHACALLQNGKVECWGDNGNGELGNGSTTASSLPVTVAGVEGAIAIAAGAGDTCAILIGGDLKCWGDNSVGQLGTGNFNDSHVPAQVASLSSGAEQVTLGEDFGCALIATPGATVVCWGDADAQGQLGDGSFTEDDPFPTQVFGLTAPPAGGPGGPEQVEAGSHHACVVLFTGKVECWGEGDFGNLGDGSKIDRAVPTPTIGLPGAAGPAAAVAVGRTTGCAVTASLSAACWGADTGNGTLADQLTAAGVKGLGPGTVGQVSAGLGACAVTVTGAPKCWGDNGWGEVGDGTTTARAAPVPVSGLPTVETISDGGNHTCALVHNGGARCWGANGDGQLGDGTTTQRHTPVTVLSMPLNLAQISAGGLHTCALFKNGHVDCWGHNNHGQLGDNSTSDTPFATPVASLAGVVQIAAGYDFTCALTSAGGVSCWGDNKLGQLGDGTISDSDIPVQVSGLTTGVLALTAGNSTACAVLQSDQVRCWGDGTQGALGDGSFTGSVVPVTVSGLTSDGASISGGTGNTMCGLNSSEQAQCWGYNGHGQLGNGTKTKSNVPVPVQGL
jgi:alpha-tubulin suppressor-like RCC1 family protein